MPNVGCVEHHSLFVQSLNVIRPISDLLATALKIPNIAFH